MIVKAQANLNLSTASKVEKKKKKGGGFTFFFFLVKDSKPSRHLLPMQEQGDADYLLT